MTFKEYWIELNQRVEAHIEKKMQGVDIDTMSSRDEDYLRSMYQNMYLWGEIERLAKSPIALEEDDA
jgi:hypothetical protein